MKNKSNKVLFIILIAILFLFSGIYLSTKINSQPKTLNTSTPLSVNPQLITSPTPIPIREKGKVAYVVDGDTIELTDKRRIRYIGINTPEINFGKGNPQCFATDAARINKELVSGQDIEMEKDVSHTDKYGRLLRFVYVDDVLINDFLLRQGYARLDQVPPDTRLSRLFKEAVTEAKENKRGLWEKCEK